MRIPVQKIQEIVPDIKSEIVRSDRADADTGSKAGKKKRKRKGKKALTTTGALDTTLPVSSAASSIKIKQLPKNIREVLARFNFNEEKSVNEPQPLGPHVKSYFSKKDARLHNIDNPLLPPLNQVIKVYEEHLESKRGDAKNQNKISNLKRFIEAIKCLLEAGADPELLYYETPDEPERNPLVNAIMLNRREKEFKASPSLFSTLLKYSSFDVNKAFFDYDGWKNFITPLSYMLGTNSVNELDYSDDILNELLCHPDLEINAGPDLLNMLLTKEMPEVIRQILDFGFNPTHTQITNRTALPYDTKVCQNYGTLLNYYDYLLEVYIEGGYIINPKSFQSINMLFNSGIELDLLLKDKKNLTLFKYCSHTHLGHAFLLELCINELKIQSLQIWLGAQLAEISHDKSLNLFYDFINKALGEPSTDAKQDFVHLHTALQLEEKVISPVLEIVNSVNTVEKLRNIPDEKLKELLESTGFKSGSTLVKPQMIDINNCLSASDLKQSNALRTVTMISNENKAASSKHRSTPIKSKELTATGSDEDKDSHIMISPLEYAALKGDKFLTQVLLMYPNVREDKIAILSALRLAIIKVNLNVIPALLAQPVIKDPLPIFEFALNSQNYFEPGRQFAVVRLVLDQHAMKNVPNRELGKAFLKFNLANNLKLSAILFRAIKKRVFEKIGMYDDIEKFRKFIATEFFAGDLKALNSQYWSFLLRPLKKPHQDLDAKASAEDTNEGDASDNEGETSDQDERPALVESSDDDENSDQERDAKNPTPARPNLSNQKSEKKSEKIKESLGFHKASSSSKAPTINLKTSIGNILAGFDDDLPIFYETDKPLIDNVFAALSAKPANLSEAFSNFKQINVKRLAKYLVKFGKEQVIKSKLDEGLDSFLFAYSLLKKIDILTDDDKRFVARINFSIAAIYLKLDYLDSAINYFKISERSVGSIQNMKLDDAGYQLYTLFTLIDIIEKKSKRVTDELKTIYLKAIDCCHLLLNSDKLPPKSTLHYIDMLNTVHNHLSNTQCLQLYLKVMNFFYKIKDTPLKYDLNENHYKLYCKAFFTVIKDYRSIPKENWVMIIDCFVHLRPKATKDFSQMSTEDHNDEIAQLNNIMHIISEIYPDDTNLCATLAIDALAHQSVTLHNEAKKPSQDKKSVTLISSASEPKVKVTKVTQDAPKIEKPLSEEEKLEAEYQMLSCELVQIYSDAKSAAELLHNNREKITKILKTKYATSLNKVNLDEETLNIDTNKLKPLEEAFYKLLEIKNTKQLELKEIINKLKENLTAATPLKTDLSTKSEVFRRVDKIYKVKVESKTDISQSSDPTHDIKAKLERAREEREAKKRQEKVLMEQQAREQADRKKKWQKEQENKRKEQKTELTKSQSQVPKFKSQDAVVKRTEPKAKDLPERIDESKTSEAPLRSSVSQKQQNFLRHALKNLLYIGFHYADFRLRHREVKSQIQTTDAELLDDITHYAICYDMLRCFQALSIYKNFGGHTAPSLPKEDISGSRQAIIHSGLLEAKKQAVIESAELFYKDLPKDLISRRNARQMNELQLEQAEILQLIRNYKLASDPERFSIENSLPLLVDDMPLYQHLVRYHSTKQIASMNDEELWQITWKEKVPIIKNIMAAIIDKYPTRPETERDIGSFLERFLPHLQALKMLFTICGEYRTERECHQKIGQLIDIKEQLQREKIEESDGLTIGMLDDSIAFYAFLRHCRVIRNSVGHEFPEDASIQDIYGAWILLKAVKNEPNLEIPKLKQPKSTVQSPIDPAKIKSDSDLDSDLTKTKSESTESSSREKFKKALAKKNFEFFPRPPSSGNSSAQTTTPAADAMTDSDEQESQSLVWQEAISITR